MTQSTRQYLGEIAACYISEAFSSLEQQHVIPASYFAPDACMGRDFSSDMMSTETLGQLKQLMEDLYPHRFQDNALSKSKELTSLYTTRLLESAIYLCTIHGQDYSNESQGIREAVEAFLSALDAKTVEVAACRVVAHLTTRTGRELDLDEAIVIPCDDWSSVFMTIKEIIPGAGAALPRELPFTHPPPMSVVCVKDRCAEVPYEFVEQLSHKLDSFLRAVRLMTGATAASGIEIRGSTTWHGLISPYKLEMQLDLFIAIINRRVAVLDELDAGKIASLISLLPEHKIVLQGFVIPPFSRALTIFSRAHQHIPYFDRLDALVTALEAVLNAGEDRRDALALRLGQRAAYLLACKNDTSVEIFNDVKTLYDMRSRFEHGEELSDKWLNKKLRRLSCVSDNTARGEAAELAVDRLRDIVRRSILARAILAEADLWPFTGAKNVDTVFVDDAQREKWRDLWQHKLESLDMLDTALRARPSEQWNYE